MTKQHSNVKQDLNDEIEKNLKSAAKMSEAQELIAKLEGTEK